METLSDECLRVLNKACERMLVGISFNKTDMNNRKVIQFDLPSGHLAVLQYRDVQGIYERAKRATGTIVIDNDDVTVYNLDHILFLNMRLFLPKKKKADNSFTGGYKTYDDSKGRGGNKEWKADFGNAQFESFFDNSIFGDTVFDFMSREEMEEFLRNMTNGPKAQSHKFTETEEDKRRKEYDEFHRKQQEQRERARKQYPHNEQQQSRGRESQYHILLGVKYGATQAEVKAGYRASAMTWHPDRNQHRVAEAEAMMKRINEAYRILTA